MASAGYKSEGREGRTWAVTNDGLVAFQKLDGTEEDEPAHEKLRKAAGWKLEDFLVGGGAVMRADGTVRITFKSGTYQFGVTLKTRANETDKDTAMQLRDLSDLGINLDKADAELNDRITEGWDHSASTIMYHNISADALAEMHEAARKLSEKYTEAFPDVDVLDVYKSSVAACRSAGCADFQKKGAASALRPLHLERVHAALPDQCPVLELDFRYQDMLFATWQGGAALGKLLEKCPDLKCLYLVEAEMTPDALQAFADAMPEWHQIRGFSISCNRTLLSSKPGINALKAFVQKARALQRLQLAECGVEPSAESELKEELKKLHPGLKFMNIAPLAKPDDQRVTERVR